ncbi:DNA photolyase family protein [Crocinitomix sp.]|nr:DNA photolyase family protein [Crocinitomix sp.]
MEKLTYFWFRRDLRLNDNTGLKRALKNETNVQPIFIFDTTILADLPKDDARVTFIWEQLKRLNKELNEFGASLRVEHGDPLIIWQKIIDEREIKALYTNRDYEPNAIERDKKVRFLMESNAIEYHDFKDHVFFEKDEVLKKDGTPYTVYTPYKNKWLEKYAKHNVEIPKKEEELNTHYTQSNYKTPTLKEIGFEKSAIKAPVYNLKGVDNYDVHRDFPAQDATTHIGHHLRFGTVSVRSVVYFSNRKNQTFLSEIIWRDFFSQILAHFPYVADGPFKKKYGMIEWRNYESEFKKWCDGETGYPIVDAGMRELNTTGFMHNRVRMITASFLIKHLLIDWRWGEAYFAEKLLDYDLSSNNGNWQWAAGTGCDAAPYFRVFNPTLQSEKFDKQNKYIQKWVPEFDTANYIAPMVDHKMARERAIATYKKGLDNYSL